VIESMHAIISAYSLNEILFSVQYHTDGNSVRLLSHSP